MRNRKLNRGLLPLVVLVWGLIGYRFWYEDSPNENEPQAQTEVLAQDKLSAERDTFSLSLPFRDPFLGKSESKDNRSAKRHKIKVPTQASTPLPHITYQGSLQAEKRLGLLIWEGKSHTVWPDESIYNANIKHIDPQYIDLIIGGKTYRIERGKSIGAG